MNGGLKMIERSEPRVQPRLVGIKDFMIWSGLGRNSARELGERIGCTRRLGGRVLYDLKVADAYLDKLDTEENKT